MIHLLHIVHRCYVIYHLFDSVGWFQTSIYELYCWRTLRHETLIQHVHSDTVLIALHIFISKQVPQYTSAKDIVPSTVVQGTLWQHCEKSLEYKQILHLLSSQNVNLSSVIDELLLCPESYCNGLLLQYCFYL